MTKDMYITNLDIENLSNQIYFIYIYMLPSLYYIYRFLYIFVSLVSNLIAFKQAFWLLGGHVHWKFLIFHSTSADVPILNLVINEDDDDDDDNFHWYLCPPMCAQC